MVFFAHFLNYSGVTLPDNILNNLFVAIYGHMNQLIVTMFLFYSGFGIMASLKSKGDKYAKGFFLRRFLPLYLYFVFMEALYLIEGLCLGNQYSWSDILLALVAWDNWFMFVTFALYILIILVFLFPKLTLVQKNIIFTILSVGLMVVLHFAKGSYWYNTLLCFNLGTWFCLFKDKIDPLMKKHLVYLITLIGAGLLFIGFGLLYHFCGQNQIFYIGFSSFFSIIIVLLSMKVRSRSPILNFIGHHVFGIYMLHKLCIGLLARTPLFNIYPLLFVVSLLVTVLAAFVCDFVDSKIKKKYFSLLDGRKTTA